MKKKRIPKDLEITPTTFEICLSVPDPIEEDQQYASVDMKFGDEVGGIHEFDKQQCLKVSKWFAQLAAAL